MKKTTVAGILAASLLTGTALATPAGAKTFSFSLTSSNSDVASGFITATGSGTTYTATGITGTINGNAITGLSGFAAADQVFFLAPQHFTQGGLSFTDTLSTAFNLTNYPDGNDHITNSVIDPGGTGTPTPYLMNFSISAVPEPATWALMIGGMGAVGFALRRRNKQAVRVTYA